MEQDKLQLFIASRIMFLRQQQGISQEKLSELAGLGSKHIHNIEPKFQVEISHP
ncbi:helix-turn-helix transcriptional regulator [Streptococcus parasuis]|uniref:helix-turn-helix transcriptional regulator n=1 Tax=Streptococcus parasuis TaxID=1501662 RepID=UPI002FC63E13